MATVTASPRAQPPDGPKIYCNVTPGYGIDEGDAFTVAGIRMLCDGSFLTNCEPGTETVFTARIAND